MDRKQRILAVDDNPANLLALEAVLGKRYEVIRALSGAEALAILGRDTNVDVILLDVQMPEMDGYEVAARIKNLPGCDVIPLIFITAIYTEDPHVKRGYALGAVDYFTKPFDPDILRLKVDAYAALRQRSALVRERERQLHESEEVLRAGRKLAALLAGLPAGVIITDTGGRVCQANEPVLRILKSAAAMDTGAYGEVLAWWQRNDRMKSPDAPLARALASAASTHNEVVAVQCFDGSTKRVLESTSPLRGLDGRVMGAVIVMQDLSERKKVAADFEARIAHLVSLGVELEQDVSPA